MAAWNLSLTALDPTSENYVFNVVFNDELRIRNSMASGFRTIFDSISSIMMIAFLLNVIVEKSFYQRLFDIVILTHHLD